MHNLTDSKSWLIWYQRGRGYLHIDYSEEIAETQEEKNAETHEEEIVETQDETLAALANDSCSENKTNKKIFLLGSYFK